MPTPTFSEVWRASQERYNSFDRIVSATSVNPNPEGSDDLFDVSELKGTKYAPYAWGFHGISQTEAQRRKDQLDKDLQNMEILDAAPWYKTLPAQVVTSLTDPSEWLAFGAGNATANVVGVGLALTPLGASARAIGGTMLAVNMLATGAASWAMQNYAKRMNSLVDSEDTWKDLLINTSVGMGLNYGFGKISGYVGGKFKEGAEYVISNAAVTAQYVNKRLKGEEATFAELKKQYYSHSDLFSVKPGRVKSVLSRYTHGILGGLSPHNRVIMRGGKETQLALLEMKTMDRNTAMNKMGVPSQISVESKITRAKNEALADFEDIHAEAFTNSGINNKTDFHRELQIAYLTPEGRHANPVIQSAAKRLKDISDKLENDLIEVGLLAGKGRESSYYPIAYSRSAILKSSDELQEAYLDYMTGYFDRRRRESIQQKWEIRSQLKDTVDPEARIKLIDAWEEADAYAKLGRDDVVGLAAEVATHVGTGDRTNGDFTMVATPKKGKTYRKERVIKVPQTELIPFTDSDFYSVFRNYLSSATADLEIAKVYGPSLSFTGSESHKRILAERDRLMKQYPKFAPWTMSQYNRSIRELDGMLMRLRGKPVSVMSDGFAKDALKLQRSMSALCVLGASWGSSIVETATLCMTGSAVQALKHMSPSIWSKEIRKLSKAELRSLKLGLDQTWSSMHGKGFSDLVKNYNDSPSKTAKIVQVVDAGGNIQYKWTGVEFLEKFRMKLLANAVRARASSICDRVARGKAKKKDLIFGRALGLSDEDMKNIGLLIGQHGKVKHGYLGIDKWGEPHLANKMKDALNMLLVKRSTAVQAVDLPFFYDNEYMKSIVQFCSWTVAYTNKLLIPGIMDHRPELAATIGGLIALSFCVNRVKRAISGDDTEIPIWEEGYKAVKDTGIGTWMTDLSDRVDNLYSGLRTNNYRRAMRAFGKGPAMVQDIAIVAGSLFNGHARDGNLTSTEYNALYNVIPYHNAPGIVGLFKPRYNKKHHRKKRID